VSIPVVEIKHRVFLRIMMLRRAVVLTSHRHNSPRIIPDRGKVEAIH
jgi:hypothetical protein